MKDDDNVTTEKLMRLLSLATDEQVNVAILYNEAIVWAKRNPGKSGTLELNLEKVKTIIKEKDSSRYEEFIMLIRSCAEIIRHEDQK